MQKKYGAQGFTVVSVSNDDTAQEAGKFARDLKTTFPVVHDPSETVYKKFSISPIPANVVIDRKGRVVFVSEEANVRALESAVARTMKAK